MSSHTASTTTVYSIPSWEEPRSDRGNVWQRVAKQCRRLARLCIRGDYNVTAHHSKRLPTSNVIATDDEKATQHKRRFCEQFRSSSGSGKGRLTSLRNKLQRHRQRQEPLLTDDSHVLSGLFRTSEETEGSESMSDADTTLSEVDSPWTPTQHLSVSRWEMEDVIQAVESEDAVDAEIDPEDRAPWRTRSQSPELPIVAEIIEAEAEIIEGEDPDWSEAIVTLRNSIRSLSVVYEEDESEDGDDSFDCISPGLDLTTDSFDTELERAELSDDEIPPALAAITRQLSPSPSHPRRLKRSHSAPAMLPSQTLASMSPPPTSSAQSTESPAQSDSSDHEPPSCDTSTESSFEALRRFWSERCEADTSLSSFTSSSSHCSFAS